MDVVCPQCGATYELNESQIPGASARVKCSSCEHIFRVHKHPEGMGPPTYTATTSNEAIAADPLPSPVREAPAVQQITVRSSNGVTSHIPDQATLQRMVVERKLAPTDELSYDGETWYELGSLPELEPFFQLLVQASPSQAHLTGNGPVLISGQVDPASTLEFGLPSSYDPSMFPPSRPGMLRAEGSISQETARYQESHSGQYSSGTYPMHTGSHENVSYGVRAPVFSSQSSVNALPASTNHYNNSSSELLPEISGPAMEGVSFTTLKRSESAENSSAESPVQVKFGQNQTRIPTMITKSDDNWPIGPAAQSPSNENAASAAAPVSKASHSGLHSSSSIEPYFISQDDLPQRPPSRAGRWFALIILILGLGIGSYSLLNPDIFGKVAFWLKLSDTNLKALQHIREARELVQQVTPKAFEKANQELEKARKDVGSPFTAYLATKATVELLQVDILDLRLSLLGKKQRYWKKKLAELQATQAKQKAQDDDQDDAKSSTLMQQTTALANLLKKWEKQSQRWRKEFNRRWQTAKKLVGEASKRDAKHPYTMIARLHLRSLSRAANSSKQNSDFQAHYSRVLDKLEDRSLQGWIYLHGASVAIRHKKFNRGLGLIRNAVKYCKHPNWLYPRLLGAWVWVEKGNTKKAETILGTIDKNVSEHPRVGDFREILNPPSLETLLASYGEAKTTTPSTRPDPENTNNVDAGSPTTPDAGAGTPEVAPPEPKASKPKTLTTSKLMARAYSDCYRGLVARGLRRAKQALRRVKNGYSYSTIGWCYLQRKQFSRAMRSFHNATRFRGRRSDTYYGLGLSYLFAGKKSKACDYFRRHLRTYPRHSENGEVRVLVKKHKCN